MKMINRAGDLVEHLMNFQFHWLLNERIKLEGGGESPTIAALDRDGHIVVRFEVEHALTFIRRGLLDWSGLVTAEHRVWITEQLQAGNQWFERLAPITNVNDLALQIDQVNSRAPLQLWDPLAKVKLPTRGRMMTSELRLEVPQQLYQGVIQLSRGRMLQAFGLQ